MNRARGPSRRRSELDPGTALQIRLCCGCADGDGHHPTLLERMRDRGRLASPVRFPLIIGHRGAAGEAPENTLAAFELALRQGAEGIEFDVHLSADGVPVVIHDPRLERTTSGSGWVRQHSAEALQRLDAGAWFNRRYPARAGARFPGLRIPLLAEVLAWVRERKALAFLEIKEGGATYPGIEAAVLEHIARAETRPLSTVISFDLATLRRLRQLDSQISLGIDFNRPLLAIRRAESIGATSLLPHWAFASQRLIDRAHRAGIRVFAWDADGPAALRRMISRGVDGVVTRYPAKAAEIRTPVGARGL